MASIYIHVPYCTSKCLYCDFYSLSPDVAPFSLFAKAIVSEIGRRAHELSTPIHTLYIGGGTPSLLPPSVIDRILDAVYARFSFVSSPELTIELNPDDVSASLVSDLSGMGFNRISAGIQSLDDSELRRVGRRHDSRKALSAMELLRSSFPNVSFDVIFGLPGQTLASFENTLSRILSFCPDHLSAYSLMFEPGTPLTVMRDKGIIAEPPQELSRQMFDLLTLTASCSGLSRYETSNYARPGMQSRHNLAYWTGIPYLGFGPSAHSYDGEAVRRANPPSLCDYISYHTSSPSGKPFFIEENLSTQERIEEFIITRSRLACGFPIPLFSRLFGNDEAKALLERARPQISSGNIILDYLDSSGPDPLRSVLRINPDKVLISDTIILPLLPE